MKAEYIKSAYYFKDCPALNFPEIAFIGKSNVGKSSLINTLVERKTLVKTSKTPGKTKTNIGKENSHTNPGTGKRKSKGRKDQS